MKIGEKTTTECINCQAKVEARCIEVQYKLYGGEEAILLLKEHYEKGRKRCKGKYKVIDQ